MDFDIVWYENEMNKEKALKEELDLIYKISETKNLIIKCLYKMNSCDANKQRKQIYYLELRNYISIEDIEIVVLTSTENLDLGYFERNYINYLKDRVKPDSQYQIFEQSLSWENLILFMIEESKGL